MMIRHLPAVLVAALLTVSAARAADTWAAPDIRAARAFQTALKDGDRSAIARMLTYPVARDYPMPPVRNAAEFLARWDEFFDSANMAALLRGKPEQIGAQGVSLANGKVWFSEGKLGTLNLKTDLYRKRLDAAKKVEAAMLYPSARGYERVPVTCSTRTKHIRIQEHGDGYRYFAWPKDGSLSQKPELELKGSMDYEGSGGGEVYSFVNFPFRYVFEANRMCERAVCPDLLTVSRGDQEISRQVCR